MGAEQRPARTRYPARVGLVTLAGLGLLFGGALTAVGLVAIGAASSAAGLLLAAAMICGASLLHLAVARAERHAAGDRTD